MVVLQTTALLLGYACRCTNELLTKLARFDPGGAEALLTEIIFAIRLVRKKIANKCVGIGGFH